MNEPALRDDQTFIEVLKQLYAVKHTGAVTFHFAQGQAVKAELPCEPTRIRLDTGKKKAHA